jgi:adenylate cyclase, class 2
MTKAPRPTETEIKLRMASPRAAREAVARIGAELVRPRHLEDNVLLDDTLRSLRRRGHVLRLRRTPGESVLTFKGPGEPRTGVKTREEIETAVADADAAAHVLERLGFRPVFRYQKYREVYRWREQEIVVDETPIGTFLEIEGDVEGIHAAAAALGFAPSDFITDSYVGLFFASGGRGDMVFEG